MTTKVSSTTNAEQWIVHAGGKWVVYGLGVTYDNEAEVGLRIAKENKMTVYTKEQIAQVTKLLDEALAQADSIARKDNLMSLGYDLSIDERLRMTNRRTVARLHALWTFMRENRV